MPLLNILMGNRHYYPTFEAAEEVGLPVLIHPTATEGGFQTSVAFAGGITSTYIERHTVFSEVAMGNITGMVFEGVFVGFPGLKVLAAEFGYSWPNKPSKSCGLPTTSARRPISKRGGSNVRRRG